MNTTHDGSQITPAHQLNALGQSVWLDSISRDMLQTGELQRLVDELGVVGVTSNPTIFAAALAGSSTYDDDMSQLAARGLDERAIFACLAVDDIRGACDVLAGVHARSNGLDGMVSIELEPDLAHDTDASIERARELWTQVDRPNVMIKVPATDAGMPVIETLVFEGINVNVTLLFSVGVYREVMQRYLRGLERRVEARLHLDVASVASFFVSRVDTAVDAALDARGGDSGGGSSDLHGRIAVANAQLAWQAYLSVFTSPRFMALKNQGARPQRPLWASTGTKNAAYSDVLYVQELIGAGTVNTMPLATLRAFADHGEARITLDERTSSNELLGELSEQGVDLDAVTEQLRTEGVAAFERSYDELIDGIAAKRAQLAAPAQ